MSLNEGTMMISCTLSQFSWTVTQVCLSQNNPCMLDFYLKVNCLNAYDLLICRSLNSFTMLFSELVGLATCYIRLCKINLSYLSTCLNCRPWRKMFPHLTPCHFYFVMSCRWTQKLSLLREHTLGTDSLISDHMIRSGGNSSSLTTLALQPKDCKFKSCCRQKCNAEN